MARYGIPKTDAERVASHYGISVEEAEEWLTIHPVEMLLPSRGSGLAGIGNPDSSFWRLDNPWLWAIGVGVGLLILRRK